LRRVQPTQVPCPPSAREAPLPYTNFFPIRAFIVSIPPSLPVQTAKVRGRCLSSRPWRGSTRTTQQLLPTTFSEKKPTSPSQDNWRPSCWPVRRAKYTPSVPHSGQKIRTHRG